jgi:hypothetical protein
MNDVYLFTYIFLSCLFIYVFIIFLKIKKNDKLIKSLDNNDNNISDTSHKSNV